MQGMQSISDKFIDFIRIQGIENNSRNSENLFVAYIRTKTRDKLKKQSCSFRRPMPEYLLPAEIPFSINYDFRTKSCLFIYRWSTCPGNRVKSANTRNFIYWEKSGNYRECDSVPGIFILNVLTCKLKVALYILLLQIWVEKGSL